MTFPGGQDDVFAASEKVSSLHPVFGHCAWILHDAFKLEEGRRADDCPQQVWRCFVILFSNQLMRQIRTALYTSHNT